MSASTSSSTTAATRHGWSRDLVLYSGCEVDGTRYGHYRFDLKEHRQREAPTWLSSLRLAVGETRLSSLLIAAPRCPQPPRAWGVFIPLHALRSETDWGAAVTATWLLSVNSDPLSAARCWAVCRSIRHSSTRPPTRAHTDQ